MRQKAENSAVTEEDWDQRWQAIVAKHETDGASEQMRAGWKAWLAERDAERDAAPSSCVIAAAPIEIEED